MSGGAQGVAPETALLTGIVVGMMTEIVQGAGKYCT